MTASALNVPGLGPGITVFERGWLSSNNVLLVGGDHAALVDTGYASHADQTVALVRRVLEGRALDLIVNTHLHSDHCGGNAALQRAFSSVATLIPPGHAQAVREWDTVSLTYEPTGQYCERFGFDDVLVPGKELRLGASFWQVHAAPGHDPHSVVLYEPQAGILMSADALWENGFGVVFPELEGVSAFDAVATTLDVIEQLHPRHVIPGHGPIFGGEVAIGLALSRARSRLESFVSAPDRHARHAAKVLMKFKLLELQSASWETFVQWAIDTPYLNALSLRQGSAESPAQWFELLTHELVRAGAARLEAGRIVNA